MVDRSLLRVESRGRRRSLVHVERRARWSAPGSCLLHPVSAGEVRGVRPIQEDTKVACGSRRT